MRVAIAAAVACIAGCSSESFVGQDAGSTKDSGAAADAGAGADASSGIPDAAPPDAAPDPNGICPPVGNTSPADCPEGGVFWNGRCYFFTGNLERWSDAHTRCAEKGAYLATITCATEHAKIRSLIFDITNVGATRAPSWTWDEDEPWGYADWPGGVEPPADPDLQCLWLSNDSKFYPAPCGATAKVLCEIGPRVSP
jgi:hypothetical protein